MENHERNAPDPFHTVRFALEGRQIGGAVVGVEPLHERDQPFPQTADRGIGSRHYRIESPEDGRAPAERQRSFRSAQGNVKSKKALPKQCLWKIESAN
jgi:hypothetical protein